jgi:hypothetical protein
MNSTLNKIIGTKLGLIPLVIAYGLLMANEVKAYEYEADGTLDGTNYLAHGSTTKLAQVTFKLYVRDCQWFVHITQQNAKTKYVEAGFDGQALYKSAFLDEKSVANLTPKPVLWTGSITPDTVPFFAPEPHIPIIWFALASGCYLNGAKDRLIPPYSTDIKRDAIVANVTRLSAMPSLPQTVIFLDDGINRKFGEPSQHPPPYENGFTNAIYIVNAFTNIGGYVLPSEFTLKVYRPASSTETNKIEILAEYDGYVNNFNPKCVLKTFIPDVESAGFILDKRFASADAAVERPFLYKTNRWLSKIEAESLPTFSNYATVEHLLSDKIPAYISHGNQVPVTGTAATVTAFRYTMLAIFICSSSVFIYFCFRHWNK